LRKFVDGFRLSQTASRKGTYDGSEAPAHGGGSGTIALPGPEDERYVRFESCRISHAKKSCNEIRRAATTPRVMRKMRKLSWKKLGLGTLAAVGALALGLGVTTAARQHRKFEAPYPALHASREPAVIERGRYLALGAAHCVDCHGAPQSAGAGALTGGREFHLPVGVFRVPNITPDPKTGIGRYTDAELARMLRYGVRPNGEAMLPFMPFQNLSDEDLTALLSFLRSQTPVEHPVAPHELTALGRVVKAFVLTPRGPSAPPPVHVEREATPAYGRYLAHNVGNCVACHTRIDLRTGAFTGPIFAGGALHPSTTDPSQNFMTPNLTPDKRWGWLNGWTEDAFVARFRGGRVHAGSPMPWEAFANIDESDARAIYRYLRTLPPSPGGPDPGNRNSVEHAVAER
jgi:mono/diheme cytochrome c family protein